MQVADRASFAIMGEALFIIRTEVKLPAFTAMHAVTERMTNTSGLLEGDMFFDFA